MKKGILLIFFWGCIIFSVIAQLSDTFINWLSPNAVSLIDERMTYTFVPIIINFFIIFLLGKIRVKKGLFLLSFFINFIFFLIYSYYQFGDIGLGKFR